MESALPLFYELQVARLMVRKEKPKNLPALCDKYGKWKNKLEKYLRTDEIIMLLALGNVKFGVDRSA